MKIWTPEEEEAINDLTLALFLCSSAFLFLVIMIGLSVLLGVRTLSEGLEYLFLFLRVFLPAMVILVLLLLYYAFRG